MNTLYLGDCLNVLRDNIPDESVDLVYIDPPFNSKRDYNIFFDDKEIQTQRIAFEDTWTLKNITDSLAELHTLKTDNLYYLLLTYQKVAPHAFPYLTMMALRILELHRVLKPTGSFYLHCDPTMSHYLKTICDLIFGEENYRNEIIWKRSPFAGSSKSRALQLPRNHDTILFFTKSNERIWNVPSIPYDEKYLQRFKWQDERGFYRKTLLKTYSDETLERLRSEDRLIEPTKPGAMYSYKQYLDESRGYKQIDDIWIDINMINPVAKERLGYPTQKPKALLERIIQASSNEGDIVLDGFCGCGTTIDAAEGLHRNWIGIDISPIAISLIKRRLNDTYEKSLSKFEVRGTPIDEQSAIELWKQNPFAFQDWWLTEFEVFSTTFGTKGADKGVDGLAQYLKDPKKQDVIRAAFQVKGGHIQSKDIDALLGAMDKHKCEIGVFLTIEEPTKPMLDTVAGSGFVEIPGYKIPKLQILTLKDYFKNKLPKLPQVNITFKAAQLKGKKKQNQIKLEM
ncbi:MAG: restriction endonuclease [bacterium]|nr:restriction endonuclease [bacterium]